MTEPRTYEARLVETRPLSEGARHMVFEVAGPERFEFRPGQHLRMLLAPDDVRYYSIASPPGGDNRFELCVATAEDTGECPISALEPGAELRCCGPSGNFALREPLRDSLFIATGTGVAPLRSMILSILQDPSRQDRRVALLLGARTPERVLYAEEMERLANDHENFEFWPTLTRANGDWAGRRGRVLMHLADALSTHGRQTDVYVCGQPEMVSQVREELLGAGLDEGALFHERY